MDVIPLADVLGPPAAMVIVPVGIIHALLGRRPWRGSVGILLLAAVTAAAFVIHSRAWVAVFELRDAFQQVPPSVELRAEVAALIGAAATVSLIAAVVLRHTRRRRTRTRHPHTA